MRREAFTLLELVVTMAVIALVAALILPWAVRRREMSRRDACTANLKQIGLGLAMYSNDFNGWRPTTGVGIPEGQERSLRSLSLIRCCYVTLGRVFICPSTSDTPERMIVRNHYVVSTMTRKGCSYAYDQQKPPGSDLGVAICADKPASTNPGAQNSPNHQGRGQNVLYVDLHVKWTGSVNVGLRGDNIFTGAWSGPGGTLPITDTYCTAK